MNEDIILKEKHGLVTVLSMNYRPYNLIGPTLTRPLLDALKAAVEEGSRAVVLRSALRHFCAGADVSLFASRPTKAAQARWILCTVSSRCQYPL